jgi:SAM-dependent methyltransferase
VERTECGSCGGTDLQPVVDLGKTPLANTFPATNDAAEHWYPLGMLRCSNCGLAQSSFIVPDPEIYGEDYGFYSGGSVAQREYHWNGAQMIAKQFREQADHGVLEIACNDGSLLKYIRQLGFSVAGVDPARPAEAAIAEGLPVTRASFTADLAQSLGEHGLVIMYNALAHIADLNDVLQGIRRVLRPDGLAVIEFQYLADLIVGNQIGQVYHEHRYFYTLDSFRRAAHLQGLSVVDAELIELQGGGLRVVLSRNHDLGISRRAERILNSERWLREAATYESIQPRFERVRSHTLDLIDREMGAGRHVVGYAAAAKATTIMNWFGMRLPYVIDTTPYKDGRFVPGVRVPIISPDRISAEARTHNIQTRVLFAGNYLSFVLRQLKQYTNTGGRWLVIEPSPMVI